MTSTTVLSVLTIQTGQSGVVHLKIWPTAGVWVFFKIFLIIVNKSSPDLVTRA